MLRKAIHPLAIGTEAIIYAYGDHWDGVRVKVLGIDPGGYFVKVVSIPTNSMAARYGTATIGYETACAVRYLYQEPQTNYGEEDD